MRIQGPRFDDIPGRQPQVRGPDGERNTPVAETRSAGGRSAGLSRLFDSGGMPQSPSLIRSLEAELVRAGLDPSSLDRTTALRALLLHRHGLPLTGAAVTGDLANQPAVSEAVAALVEDARAFLASGNTGATGATGRRLVTTLIADLTALYDRPGDGATMTVARTAALDRWAHDTETLLIRLLTGETGTPQAFSGAISEPVGRMLDFILSPQPLDRLAPSVRGLIAAFRQSVEVVQVSLAQTGQDAFAIVHDALARFEGDIPAIAALAGAAGDGARAELAGLLREVLGKRLAMLQSHLEAFIPDGSPGMANDGPGGIAGFVNRSGLMFEWQLLAWYRAGKDPARLRDLYRRDLKGILMAFARPPREQPPGKQRGTTLESLRTRAAETLERIETQQLTNLLDRHDREQSAFWEMPIAGRPGDGQARIRLSGDKSDTETSAPRSLTLTFAVDTTALGPVGATLTVTGKAMSVIVEVADDRWTELGGDMADEIRDTLNSHGFSVGEVVFTRTAHAVRSGTAPGTTGGEFVA